MTELREEIASGGHGEGEIGRCMGGGTPVLVLLGIPGFCIRGLAVGAGRIRSGTQLGVWAGSPAQASPSRVLSVALTFGAVDTPSVRLLSQNGLSARNLCHGDDHQTSLLPV